MSLFIKGSGCKHANDDNPIQIIENVPLQSSTSAIALQIQSNLSLFILPAI